MDFMEAIRSGLSRYVDFGTRSSRSEYWFWTLFVIVGQIALAILAGIFGAIGLGALGGILYAIFYLGILLPSLAVSIRRLHDLGKTGWLILIAFIPIIGPIFLIVWFVTAGEESENRFGANPLGA